MDVYNNDRKTGPITLIAIMAELAIIIFVIFTVINLLKTNGETKEPLQYNVEISNFRQEISNIDKDGLKDIQFSLYDAAWLNSDNFNKSDVVNATIRSESVKKQNFIEDNIFQVYFVVDFPDLEQTYQVSHIYSTIKKYNSKLPVNYRTMVYCPKESQKIYSGQTCRDRYAGQAEQIIEEFDFE